MPTKEELLEAIKECERNTPSYANCEKMATFHTLMNFLYPNPSEDSVTNRGYSYDAEGSGSEFMKAVSGRDTGEVFRIMDEHMAIVRNLFPKEYNAVIERIRGVQ